VTVWRAPLGIDQTIDFIFIENRIRFLGKQRE
jgi:hypothetical protein